MYSVDTVQRCLLLFFACLLLSWDIRCLFVFVKNRWHPLEWFWQLFVCELVTVNLLIENTNCVRISLATCRRVAILSKDISSFFFIFVRNFLLLWGKFSDNNKIDKVSLSYWNWSYQVSFVFCNLYVLGAFVFGFFTREKYTKTTKKRAHKQQHNFHNDAKPYNNRIN